MKVLFVVNDESISTSIVKKYQKQYKEIISYKNVYYFNAIIKELQKNKNYDRIVISEDLDEIVSSNAYQRDKILFDKLDSISDEAVNGNGEDIPIILICNDRRNESEEILVKLFGIGIYNAIIGTDRTIDTVCSLINQPRSKKDAKKYYKINSDNVSYEKENDNYVSEVEIQNVLRHFKRISSDNKEIIDSFSKIVSQYNNEQLKVIIAILPSNIKNVLEEESDEYKKIANIKETKQPKVQKKKNSKIIQGTSELLLEVETSKKPSKQVVVPTTLESTLYKKVDEKIKENVNYQDNEEDENDADKSIADKVEENNEDKSIENKVEEILEEKNKKVGRTKKTEQTSENVTRKKRGRPKKDKGTEEKDVLTFLPGVDQEKEEFKEESIISKQTIQKTYETNEEQEEEEEDLYDENNVLPELSSKNIVQNNYQEEKDVIVENEEASHISERSIEKYDNYNSFKEEEFERLLTSDKKIVSFVGTSKNGTSFIVNNMAHILSNMGIDTAILDATKNKN